MADYEVNLYARYEARLLSGQSFKPTSRFGLYAGPSQLASHGSACPGCCSSPLCLCPNCPTAPLHRSHLSDLARPCAARLNLTFSPQVLSSNSALNACPRTLPSPPAWTPSVIPAVIITGFLGSGKTTLVQHVLRNRCDGVVVVWRRCGGDAVHAHRCDWDTQQRLRCTGSGASVRS